ncbi:MAG: Gfo/Idh/MocA family oxidoreductase [Pseudomonadota bacterium]
MVRPAIALIGAGLVGSRHATEAVAQATLCAIADPSAAARDLASKLDVPHFDDPATCLAAMRPAGAVIATPNNLHADHTLLCVKEGIPCLVEKPVADTLENATRIADAAENSGIPVLVGHHRRHSPIVARAKAEIESGALGEITAVSGQFWLYKPDDYFAASWRSGPGAGPSMINAIHDVDLLRYLCGPIIEVQAMRSAKRRGRATEDTAAVLLRFENGALGTFSLSDTVVAPFSWEMSSGENPVYPHVPGACYMIGGTQASLQVPDLKIWHHNGPRSWWNPIHSTQLDAPQGDAFSLQFAHFLDVIAGTPPLVSADEGRASLAIVLDILQTPLLS